MWATDGSRPIYKEDNKKTVSFSSFFLYVVDALYFLIHSVLFSIQILLLYWVMLRIETIKTKVFITISTESFYSLRCCCTCFSWLLLPDFLIAASPASSNDAPRSFLFFELVIRQVCASNGLLIVISDYVSASRMTYQGVKIAKDSHQTVEKSCRLWHNFPCKSNSY